MPTFASEMRRVWENFKQASAEPGPRLARRYLFSPEGTPRNRWGRLRRAAAAWAVSISLLTTDGYVAQAIGFMAALVGLVWARACVADWIAHWRTD